MPKHGLIVFLCNASCSKVNNLDIMVILYKGNFSDSLQLMINATCLIKLSYFHWLGDSEQYDCLSMLFSMLYQKVTTDTNQYNHVVNTIDAAANHI